MTDLYGGVVDDNNYSKVLPMGQGTGQRQLMLTIESGETQSQELFDYSGENRQVRRAVLEGESWLMQDGEELLYDRQSDLYVPLFRLDLVGEHLAL